MYALDLQNLTKKYANIVAVAGLSLTVERDRIFGFVGPDGAGKTSLFRMLCGILTPSSGRALVLGFDTVSESEKLKQELGYMAQKFALYADLTVRENLDFFADLYNTPLKGLTERKLELLKFAGLQKFQDRLAGNLSGGMKQKLALCCTLIHTPQILILDEPTTGVDPVSRQEFWNMLLPLPGQGSTVIVSTAYMDEAAKCERLALMDQGYVLKIGTPAELKTPLQGKIFEVRGRRLNEVKIGLAGCGWLKEVLVFGDRLHVQLREDISSAAGQDRLMETLRQAGFEVEVGPVEPTLEDVFVDLMK